MRAIVEASDPGVNFSAAAACILCIARSCFAIHFDKARVAQRAKLDIQRVPRALAGPPSPAICDRATGARGARFVVGERRDHGTARAPWTARRREKFSINIRASATSDSMPTVDSRQETPCDRVLASEPCAERCHS
jgi:hypothetical protein